MRTTDEKKKRTTLGTPYQLDTSSFPEERPVAWKRFRELWGNTTEKTKTGWDDKGDKTGRFWSDRRCQLDVAAKLGFGDSRSSTTERMLFAHASTTNYKP